ncbi:hypothetical protein YC2023_007467 [Brassica napus]
MSLSVDITSSTTIDCQFIVSIDTEQVIDGPTCLIWKISGLISCKPNIGDQEIYLCNQETHPRV